MKKKLIPLGEHNSAKLSEHLAKDPYIIPVPNGIACPNCGAELWDVTPVIILASNPPQKEVFCPPDQGGCGWAGYRIA